MRRRHFSSENSEKLAAGTVFEFDYTGTVQSIDLPKGRYKLQCWGAQGGDVTGTFAAAGSKGGYSEGVVILTEPQTLYIFVGGKGGDYTSSESQTSTTVLNGGWNGGGGGLRTALYSDGKSFPRPGGGATDIALVTSTMSYSSGRTDRSSESLLSRIIVAGGGAGASASFSIQYDTVRSSGQQQGGGTSGKGQYPGTQTSGGIGGLGGYEGSFGLGATQWIYDLSFCAGGGGGGWYGGGSHSSDYTPEFVNYSGGGSGFVNTAANASYRPSGYTGLQLESGFTTAGDSLHPSTSGGSETGHSGAGYAKITVVDESNDSLLPADFQIAEYIRPDGSQYIDTGVTPNINTSVHLNLGDISLPKAGDHALFGSDWGNYSLLYNSASTVKWYTNKSMVSASISSLPVEIIATLTSLSVNGVEYSVSGSACPTYNICLFNTGDNANGSGSWRGIASMYGCKIYDGSNLIRDFIPCIKISTSENGLYDIVNNAFYELKK